MTTQTYTDVIDHTSNAGFQAWSQPLHLAIVAAGLVNTADTGQADLTTAARPSTNTYVDKVYRFDDTMQGTAPVFLKVGFGTGTSATVPALRVTIGEATDGAGTLSGSTLVSNLGFSQTGAAPASTVTNYTTRVCVVDGYIGIAFGLGSTSAGTSHAVLIIGRSVDSSGASSADGTFVLARGAADNSSNALRSLQYGSGTAFTMTAGSSCLIAGGMTTTLVGGAAQVFKHYINLPRVRPIPWLMTVRSSEFGSNTQFDATPVGALQRTYVSLGLEGFNQAGNAVALPATTGQTLAMVWE